MDEKKVDVKPPGKAVDPKRKHRTASALIKRAKGTGYGADKDCPVSKKTSVYGLRSLKENLASSGSVITGDASEASPTMQQQSVPCLVSLTGLMGCLPCEVLEIILEQCSPQQLGMLETSCRYFLLSDVSERVARQQLKTIPRAKLMCPKFWAHERWLTLLRFVCCQSEAAAQGTSINGGSHHTAALLVPDDRPAVGREANHSIYCFGRGFHGQLGGGQYDGKPTPQYLQLGFRPLVERPDVEEEVMPAVVACGSSHTAAISRRGELFTWGLASSGELGHGDSSTEVALPTPSYLPPPRPRIVSVAAGGHHTLAISEDGSLWSCGRGKHGQLGQGTFDDTSTLQPVHGLRGHRIVSVAGGFQHSAALAADGTIFTWGCGKYGQLGLMHLHDLPILIANNLSLPTPCKISKLDPSRLPPANKVTALAAGAYHTVALTVGGDVLAFGRNKHGALGTGDVANRFVPTKVTVTRETTGHGSARVAQVACGQAHTLALAVRNGSSRVYAAGYNYWGQLGLDNTEDQLKFKVIPCITGASSIQVGDNHSMAIANDGTLYVWGRGDCGQLGLGDDRSHKKPVAVPKFKVVHPDRTLRRSTRAVPRLRPAVPENKKAKLAY